MKKPTDLAAWIALTHIPRLNLSMLRACLEAVGKPEVLFILSHQALMELGIPEASCTDFTAFDWQRIEADLAWLDANQAHHILPLDHPHYPPLLKETAGAPLLLYAKGNSNALTQAAIAMVGSRNPSPSGKETAFLFAKQLSAAGAIVISGLALGIDAASHRGALAAAAPTIAVLGTGLNTIYPIKNKALAEDILAGQGCLVSEFSLDTPPRRPHFPQRNRIISGMSLGTLIVEATVRSGSLITARYAGEQGREIFAIPGSIHNPMSRGCHALIRQGAKLVETTDDIIEELGALANLSPSPSPKMGRNLKNQATLDKSYQQLLEYIDFTPASIDILAERSNLKVQELSSMLLILELQGWVTTSPQGYTKACPANN